MRLFKKFTLTEWFVCLLIVGVCFSPQIAKALEFQVDKNAAFNFTAPIINATNTSIFSVGNNNTAFYIHSNDNTTFAAANTNITHISGGVYLWQLNASEMNHDRIGVYYNGTGALQQYFVINTILKENQDTGIAYIDTEVASVLEDTGTTLPATLGGLTNVTLAATQTGVTIPTVTTLTGHTAQTGDAYAIVNNAAYGNAALKTSLGNGSVVSASVTGAVGSVTGNVSAVTGAVGSISGITFPGNFSAMNITSDGNVTTAASGGLTAQNVWEYGNRTLTSAGAGGATAQEVWEYGGSRNVTVTGGTVTSVTNPVGISAGNITAATFAAGAIDASAIAANAITSSEIADDAIDAGAIAASAIGASEIATGAIDADAIATDAIGAAEVAADAGTEIGTAAWATTTRQLTGTQAFNLTGNITGSVSGSVGSVTGAVGSVTGAVGSVTGAVGSVTGNVGGNVSYVTNPVVASSVTGNVTVTNCDVATSTRGTSNLTATDNIGINWADVTGQTTAVNLTNTEIKAGTSGATAQQVWEYNTTAINTTGLAGTRLNAAGSSGDPWSTELPGSYTGSQAGYYLQELIKKSRGR